LSALPPGGLNTAYLTTTNNSNNTDDDSASAYVTIIETTDTLSEGVVLTPEATPDDSINTGDEGDNAGDGGNADGNTGGNTGGNAGAQPGMPRTAGEDFTPMATLLVLIGAICIVASLFLRRRNVQ